MFLLGALRWQVVRPRLPAGLARHIIGRPRHPREPAVRGNTHGEAGVSGKVGGPRQRRDCPPSPTCKNPQSFRGISAPVMYLFPRGITIPWSKKRGGNPKDSAKIPCVLCREPSKNHFKKKKAMISIPRRYQLVDTCFPKVSASFPPYSPKFFPLFLPWLPRHDQDAVKGARARTFRRKAKFQPAKRVPRGFPEKSLRGNPFSCLCR